MKRWLLAISFSLALPFAATAELVHDAECSILTAQNGER